MLRNDPRQINRRLQKSGSSPACQFARHPLKHFYEATWIRLGRRFKIRAVAFSGIWNCLAGMTPPLAICQ